jgi:hypothetical protein
MGIPIDESIFTGDQCVNSDISYVFRCYTTGLLRTISMTPAHEVAVLMPLGVGAIAVLCTTFIHAGALGATVNFFRYERRRGRAGAGLRVDLTIFVLVIGFAFIAHLIEIASWATLLVICGECHQFGVAFYQSAGNYTTLGPGDFTMASSWRLLGPLEAANGALMFGVSTAMIFAVIVRLMRAHFSDLRS